ncbi:hypothetical protein I4F81_001107 [Pyropia yezoensis]|uniref:Uncharacterized protein n=1 Tax=Pyropia yezoensis TaxID=2788 RepID=A0ACC3BLA1_PYRYE|nr:hypothetical protein I4F81_001107 [Neopyropia yezoensis]
MTRAWASPGALSAGVRVAVRVGADAGRGVSSPTRERVRRPGRRRACRRWCWFLPCAGRSMARRGADAGACTGVGVAPGGGDADVRRGAVVGLALRACRCVSPRSPWRTVPAGALPSLLMRATSLAALPAVPTLAFAVAPPKGLALACSCHACPVRHRRRCNDGVRGKSGGRCRGPCCASRRAGRCGPYAARGGVALPSAGPRTALWASWRAPPWASPPAAPLASPCVRCLALSCPSTPTRRSATTASSAYGRRCCLACRLFGWATARMGRHCHFPRSFFFFFMLRMVRCRARWGPAARCGGGLRRVVAGWRGCRRRVVGDRLGVAPAAADSAGRLAPSRSALAAGRPWRPRAAPFCRARRCGRLVSAVGTRRRQGPSRSPAPCRRWRRVTVACNGDRPSGGGGVAVRCRRPLPGAAATNGGEGGGPVLVGAAGGGGGKVGGRCARRGRAFWAGRTT